MASRSQIRRYTANGLLNDCVGHLGTSRYTEDELVKKS